MSTAIAGLFGEHAQDFQKVSAQAADFHDRFTRALTDGANAYAGAEASEAATAIAFAEASRRGVGLVALHVWTEPWVSGSWGSFQDAIWDAQLSAEEESLAERLAGWHERYPDVTIRRTIEIGDPARCLIEASLRAQLLVVGSHGCSWFRGRLLGSVGAAAVNSAKTPVIVARQS